MITVKHLTKEYKVPVKEEKKSFKNFFRPRMESIYGLHNVNFQIERGEFVGLAGLNGAGKTTLVKTLSGILTPTEGEISVMGYCPYRKRRKYTPNIGVVMGQKTALFYDLPVMESLKFYADIYKVSKEKFIQKLEILDECMQIRQFLHIPVRKLSLGQRMRCEIGASLLHDPGVLFLDEPTLGLDIVSKKAILTLLKTINKDSGTTMLLTTHDIEDISMLCERIILLDHGEIAYDGATAQICDRSRYKYILLEYKEPLILEDIHMLISEEERDENHVIWKVKSDDLGIVLRNILSQQERIVDISVNTESLTETLFHFFQKEDEENYERISSIL